MQLKKAIAAGALGALMAGSTLAFASSLADFPAPFVQAGAANFLVVVGSSGEAAGLASDVVGAIDLAARLGGAPVVSETKTVAVTGASVSASMSGEAASLTSASDKLYLGDTIDAQVSVLTVDDMASVLEDGTFTDDAGDEFDYEQTIEIGARDVTFSDSGGDLDNPALLVDAGDDTADPLYEEVVTFDEAVVFTSDDSIGEKIQLFGKTYTVGSKTETDMMQLLGGALPVFLKVDEAQTTTFAGKTVTVKLAGVTNQDPAEAVITITADGTTETQKIAEGGTRKIAGIDVYADTVNYYGLESRPGDAIISLGADEVYLEHGSPVMKGATKADVDGTLVTLDGDFDALTGLTIAVAASDSDIDDIQAGESLTDPVFGTFKVTLADVPNAPSISGDKGTDSSSAREKIAFSRGDDGCVKVEMKVKGDKKTVEFADEGALEDCDDSDIEIVEGAQIEEDEYFTLNSGSYQHFMQATKVTVTDDDTANDDVTLKDIFTGTEYKLEDKDLSDPTDWVIKGQTYTIHAPDDDVFTMVSSDYGASSRVAVFPYLETISGKDFKVAFTDNVLLEGVDDTTIIELPTGEYDTAGYGGTIADAVNDAAAEALVGSVYYVIDDTGVAGQVSVSIDSDQNNNVDNPETSPSLLFVEEEDNSDADTMNAVIMPTATGAYDEMDLANLVFTNGNAIEGLAFEDTDYEGSIDPFGTYVVTDTSDDNQDWEVLTYPTEQMWFNVWGASTSSAVQAAAAGGGQVTYTTQTVSPIKTMVGKLDTEFMSLPDAEKQAKNVISVGGPCVNQVTAALLGKTYPACGAASGLTSGTALIKLVENAFGGSKVALVVAGWSASNTRGATTALQNFETAGLTGTEKVM